ncbi:uncharacterized protein LOC114609279 [Grammomys surdaster]|uniref:uncharacterized protein LOC114609279 n=1 Tax=Grammomys surdaster TaxID=491861 RepID=UPI00109FEEB3|nr:uncharacterized protein LOC114609279 [Grammomys surdaster]
MEESKAAQTMEKEKEMLKHSPFSKSALNEASLPSLPAAAPVNQEPGEERRRGWGGGEGGGSRRTARAQKQPLSPGKRGPVLSPGQVSPDIPTFSPFIKFSFPTEPISFATKTRLHPKVSHKLKKEKLTPLYRRSHKSCRAPGQRSSDRHSFPNQLGSMLSFWRNRGTGKGFDLRMREKLRAGAGAASGHLGFGVHLLHLKEVQKLTKSYCLLSLGA